MMGVIVVVKKKILVGSYKRGSIKVVPYRRGDRGEGKPPFHRIHIEKTQWVDRFNQYASPPKKKKMRFG